MQNSFHSTTNVTLFHFLFLSFPHSIFLPSVLSLLFFPPSVKIMALDDMTSGIDLKDEN